MRSALQPEVFAGEQANPDPDGVAAAHRDRSGTEVLAWFDDARTRLLAAFRGLDPALRVPWYGPPMSAASALTARIMETWAHGQDVADALDVRREPTARLRHVAHIGIGARAYSFVVNGKPPPEVPIRVELAAPNGDTWTWGPDDVPDRVVGPALDFCLAVTQRRHLADTTLAVSGPVATEWMSFAQAYAGPAGTGRERTSSPGQRFPLTSAKRPIRIANCSGFYGDRIAAAREMVDGGPVDVLTGDYLAELTMLILAKAQAKDPDAGYARTFLTQVEDVLGPCLERGIKIVSNAGGLNPAGLAAAIEALGRARRLRRGRRPARLPRRRHAAGHGQAGVGQRLPRRLGHRRGAGGGRGRRRHRARHRRLAGRRARGVVARLEPHRLGRAGGRGRRGPRDRVRSAGHRRQLRVPRRDHRPALPGLPDRRGRRGRHVGDHQAPGHGRARLGRHGHRAAPLRDRRPRVPRARRAPPTSTPSRSRRTASTGSRSPVCGEARRRRRSRSRSTTSAASATR